MDDAVLEGDFAVRDCQWLEQVRIGRSLDLRTHFDLIQDGSYERTIIALSYADRRPAAIERQRRRGYLYHQETEKDRLFYQPFPEHPFSSPVGR